MGDFITLPVRAGQIVIGIKEGRAMPFEPADIDYTTVNGHRLKDPTYGQNQVPDTIVNSCSECCMEQINGRPNLLGKMHRKTVKDCRHCPVGTAGDHIQARDAAGRRLFWVNPDGSVAPMTQTELMQMETDGTA